MWRSLSSWEPERNTKSTSSSCLWELNYTRVETLAWIANIMLLRSLNCETRLVNSLLSCTPIIMKMFFTVDKAEWSEAWITLWSRMKTVYCCKLFYLGRIEHPWCVNKWSEIAQQIKAVIDIVNKCEVNNFSTLSFWTNLKTYLSDVSRFKIKLQSIPFTCVLWFMQRVQRRLSR